MDNKRIEELAINHLQSIILKHSYLNPFLSTNDKEPSWDGYIYVHNEPSNKKDTIVGRVPVQVKGTTLFNQTKQMHTIQTSDLKNYLKDGGVLYIVVYLSDNENLIYYKQLLPSELKQTLQGKGHQKTIDVKLNEFPIESEELLSLFQDFLRTREREMSFISEEPLYLDEISTQSYYSDDGNMSFLYTGSSYLDIFDKADRGELRIYYETPYSPIPVPVVNKIMDIRLYEEESTEIKIEGKTYFNTIIRERRSKNDVVIQFGQSFKLIVNSDQNTGIFNITMTKKISSIVADYEFLIAFFNNQYLELFDYRIEFPNVKNELFNIEKIESDYAKLLNVVRLWDKLQVVVDFDLDTLSDNQEGNLLFMANSVVNNISLKVLEQRDNGLYLMNFNELDLLFYGVPTGDQCIFYDFFDLRELNLLEHDVKRIITFNKLGINHLKKIGNFKVNNIIEIHKRVYLEHNFSGLEFVLLNLLNYSDSINEEYRQDVLEDCLDFSQWIYENRQQPEDSYTDLLNIYQVRYRMGSLSLEDNKFLLTLASNQDVGVEEKFAASVLLKNTSLAKDNIKSMPKEIKENLVKYPIYTLFRELE